MTKKEAFSPWAFVIVSLYNLSTADLLFDEDKKKRRPAGKSLGFFEAER